MNALDSATKHVTSAIACLAGLPAGGARSILTQLAHLIVSRQV